MAITDPKSSLRKYLQEARDAMLWKLEGLSEYDARRPLVPTGTNLLGLVKHLSGIEFAYFGATFGRPSPEEPPFDEDDPLADLFATPEESREQITGLYQRAWAHSDATIEALSLDSIGHVPHWPSPHDEVTLHMILVHVLAETHRHAGHADIVRELIDGNVGLLRNNSNLPDKPAWEEHWNRVETAAKQARDGR
ncbi:MAG TPA: DinB family protein [Streptosporangiaceae bacterium]|nr:DinB family protein [Streptosporangiaceae bacterium]